MKTFKKLLKYLTVITLTTVTFLLLFCAIARDTNIFSFHPVAYVVLFAGNMGAMTLAIGIIEDYI